MHSVARGVASWVTTLHSAVHITVGGLGLFSEWGGWVGSKGGAAFTVVSQFSAGQCHSKYPGRDWHIQTCSRGMYHSQVVFSLAQSRGVTGTFR